MLLSVVIPVHDQAHLLPWTLRALAEQTAARHEFEVVVVDDGSADDPAAAVAAHGGGLDVRIVRTEENVRRARARNLGVAESRGDHLLFLDGDSLAAPGLVEAHLRFRRERPHDVLLGKRIDMSWATLAAVKAGQPAPAPRPYDDDHREMFRLGQPDSAVLDRAPWLFGYSHNVSFARVQFDKIGGYDESFVKWGYEDNDLMYRLFRSVGRQTGRFHFDPAALCYHMPHYRDWSAEWDGARDAIPYMKDKYQHFDVELLTHPPDQRYHAQVLPYYEQCLDHLRASRHRVPAAAVDAVLPPAARPRLWVGFDVQRPGDRAFDHARPESAANHHLFGMHLPFAAGELDAVVSVDLWRMLGPTDLSAAVAAGVRTAGQVFLVLSKAERGAGLISDLGYLLAMLGPFLDVAVHHDDADMTVVRCRAGVTR